MERILAFSCDVVDEVYSRLEGRYSREQIFDVFDASISFIHHTMTSSLTLSLYIQNLGYMLVSLPDMEKRLKTLEKKALTDVEKKEMESLRKRIDDVRENYMNYRVITRDVKTSIHGLTRGKSLDYIQEFQNNIRF